MRKNNFPETMTDADDHANKESRNCQRHNNYCGDQICQDQADTFISNFVEVFAYAYHGM